MRDATELLLAVEQGDEAAAEELLPLLYDELRRLAGHLLAGERPGQTLQATALVHEAWLRLDGGAGGEAVEWSGRRHFFNAAARVMRRVLIDRARRRQSVRHGGTFQRTELDCVELAAPLPDDQLLALHEALDQLEQLDPGAAELVRLRFFVGLTHAEAAEVLGCSRSTADRTWVFARAWLFARVNGPRT